MTPERWQQVKDALQDAPAQPPAAPAAFVAHVAGDDADLAREVDSLLAAHDDAGAFIVTPALAQIDAAALVDRLQASRTWSGRRVGAALADLSAQAASSSRSGSDAARLWRDAREWSLSGVGLWTAKREKRHSRRMSNTRWNSWSN